MLYVVGVEVQLGYVSQLILSAHKRLMAVLASAHCAVKDILLYLAQVLYPVLDVLLHTVVHRLPLCALAFGFDNVVPLSHLLVYVTYSFHVSCFFSVCNFRMISPVGGVIPTYATVC